MSELAESILKCKVEGNILYLPPISDGPLANYNDVRKALLNAGAKYKRNTFVFPSDAQPFIDRLTSGQSVNIKKEFQFFPTPDDIADWLVELAEIKDGMCVLEPSAGQGAIVDAIYRAFPRSMKGPDDKPSVTIDYCELMPENLMILSKKCESDTRWRGSTSWMGQDFLNKPHSSFLYERIIANPPFSKNQDIDHIMKMWECLKPKGRVVSVASKHWQHSNNKKEKQFREFLSNMDATIHDIEAGRFKESGTMISCCVIVIDKP